VCAAVAIACVCSASRAFAQQRPLVTEDPETIGAGRLLLEGGLDYARDILFPVSGLRGDLLAVPTVGISVGVSSIAEIQLDGGLYRRLTIKERLPAPLASALVVVGDKTSAPDDLVIGTKVRIVSEATGRPAIGIRFATKLPTASNESGLGQDTTDFFASLLLGKTVQSIRVVGNVGVAILEDSTLGARQDDLLTLGLSVARALTTAAEVVGEVNGRLNLAQGDATPGAENRGIFRAGVRYTRGTVRVDAAVLIGLTSRDLDLGFTTGFTWVFDAFRVP
jgi:hypothetical protein